MGCGVEGGGWRVEGGGRRGVRGVDFGARTRARVTSGEIIAARGTLVSMPVLRVAASAARCSHSVWCLFVRKEILILGAHRGGLRGAF